MKGIADEPQYSIGLLEGGTAISEVIDNHIYEQTLVMSIAVKTHTHPLHWICSLDFTWIFILIDQ